MQTVPILVPEATIQDSELVLTYQRADHDGAAVRAQFDRDIAEIRNYLSSMKSEVDLFNALLPGKISDRIHVRRLKLLNDQQMVKSIGFPLRRRSNAPQTYAVPVVRRKIAPPPPSPGTSNYTPEPEVEMAEYEHILSVLTNMTAVIERSPSAFRKMNENHIRQHFLVQLNAQYEGQATGETFNYKGKTDILIRKDGKNLFIAECKFWRGSKSLQEALDQLLGYAAWRDTKTAMLIFNRKKDFSSVLAKIQETVKSHANCKKQLPYPSETGWRYLCHHRDDKNREMLMTVLAFEVPT
jgi:hypothetical protein